MAIHGEALRLQAREGKRACSRKAKLASNTANIAQREREKALQAKLALVNRQH